MMYKFRKTCRLCTNKTFELVLDLGNQPPSNSFLTKKELQKKKKNFHSDYTYVENAIIYNYWT